jgi:hypothetical protein
MYTQERIILKLKVHISFKKQLLLDFDEHIYGSVQTKSGDFFTVEEVGCGDYGLDWGGSG